MSTDPGDRGRRLRPAPRGIPRSAPRNTPRNAPQRVRVTSPRMGATRRPPSRPATREIDEQTGLGEVYMRSLLRSQLRHGLVVLLLLSIALASLPIAFQVVPQLLQIRVLTVPLPWLVLGVLVYPVLLVAAWWYVRAAERTERDFAAVVEHRTEPETR